MKRKTVVWLSLGLILLIVILYGVSEYFRTNTDLSDEKPVAAMQVPELIAAFAGKAAQSNQKYLDKVVAVKGSVRSVQKDGNPVVVTLGEEGEMSSVQCSMDSTHAADYSALAKGQQVTLKGLCTGAISDDLLGTDVKLSRCIIEKP